MTSLSFIMKSVKFDLDQHTEHSQGARKGSILKHQPVITTLSGQPLFESLESSHKESASSDNLYRGGKTSCSTFPRSLLNCRHYSEFFLREGEFPEINGMESSREKPNVSFLHDQLQSRSREPPELLTSHSLMASPVTPLPPEGHPRLAEYSRRGSDGLVGKGLKNRSRSAMIKLQVPSKNSPGASRKQYTPSTSDSQLSPDLRERAGTFPYNTSPKLKRRSGGFSHSNLSTVDSKKSTDGEEDEFKDDIMDVNPLVARMSYTSLYPGKRNSFLYLSDTDESGFSKPPSRTSSISSPFNAADEVYITPFAQILAKLQRVRNQFITLTDPPISEERKKNVHWTPPVPRGKLSNDEYKALSLETLDELDWCLFRLESVNSAKSMGTMAQDKFRRILSRELSHLSERSRSGHYVAEWVNNLTGNSEDYGEEIDKALDTLSVVQTSQGLENPKMTRSISQVEPIPRFGISGQNVNYDSLQEFMDSYLSNWEFDSFQLNFLTGHQPLVALAYTIFTHRGLFPEFKMSKTKFINYMAAVQTNYWPNNAFHNAVHAADVLHATNYLLKAEALENIFSNLEIMAALVSAAVHDVDHPGRTNQFLINTSHELAIMYNDESVLENHHLAVAFKLLKDPNCNFLENMEPAQTKAFRRMMIDNVLATDMSKHFKHLGELKTKVETKKVANEGILLLDKYSDRSEVLQCLLHCADLSNPTKPPEIASTWAYNIIEENFVQGDEEKKLGIDVGPLGDRDNVCVEKCQVSFIDFLIFPLWETWAELVYPDAQDILDNLSKTREYWSNRVVTSPLPSSEDEKERKASDSGVSNPDVEATLVNGMELTSSEDALLSPNSNITASLRRGSYKATGKMREIDGSLPQTDS